MVAELRRALVYNYLRVDSSTKNSLPAFVSETAQPYIPCYLYNG